MTHIFQSPAYLESYRSRLAVLLQHVPPHTWTGARVLEPGAGTGEMGEELARLGATVVSLDARPDHIAGLLARYPGREAHVIDLEHWDPGPLGQFDAVLAFGILYHLSRPAQFLEACAQAAPTVYLETIVRDSEFPTCTLVEEAGSDQAFSGHGCRPTPAWVVQTMGDLGFTVHDISSATANWGGDTPAVFDWAPAGDGQWRRGGANLRRMWACQRLGVDRRC